MKHHVLLSIWKFAIGRAGVSLGICLCLSFFPSWAAQVTMTYTYDTAGRLTGAEYNSAIAIAYTYDANGNLTRRAVVAVAPEIHVKQGATNIANGGSYNFGSVTVGSNSAVITFTIQNLGDGVLTLSGVTKGGSHQNDFTVTQPANSTVTPGGSTTFTVTFTPAATGTRTANITIANNDSDESSYVINLSGTGAAAPTGNSYLLWTK